MPRKHRESPESFFNRLTQLFRSSPLIKRKVGTRDTTIAVPDKTKSSGALLFQKSQAPTYATITSNAYNMTERLMRYQDFCLSGETLIPVATSEGSVRIDELVRRWDAGERDIFVFSYDFIRRQTAKARLTGARKTGTRETIEVVLEDGTGIVCTSDHRFMMSDMSYLEAGSLVPGSSLMGFGGSKEIRVAAVEHGVGIRDVYDLEVAGFGNFAVGRRSVEYGSVGVTFVHNCEMELCLSGDTKIATPEGFVTLEALSALCSSDPEHRFIVYSYDHERCEIVPAWAKQARQTCVEDAWKVTFDNGRSLTGTSNHRLMLRDGSYREIGDLRPGDAMMPFYRKDLYASLTRAEKTRGYNWVHTMSKNARNGWIPEHKLIAEWILGRRLEKGEVVNHKNFVKSDNRPENLDVTTSVDHSALHQRVRNGRKWSHDNAEWIEKFRIHQSEAMKTNDPSKHHDVTFGRIIEACDRVGYCCKKVEKVLGVSQTAIQNRLNENGFRNFETFTRAYSSARRPMIDTAGPANPRYDHNLTFEDVCSAYEPGMSCGRLAEKIGATSTKVIRRVKLAGYKSWSEFTRTYQNCKVVSVEHVGVMPLYDITVDGYKNFATDSVISHNTAEIGAALDLWADEAASCNDKGRVLHIHSKNTRIQSILEDLFYGTCNIDFNLRPWIRNLAKFGDAAFLNDVSPQYGVQNVIPIPINEIEREENFDPEDPFAVRFRWVTLGNKVLENWEVTHMRLLGNDAFLPYGTSLIEAARRVWRQLILIEDAMLVYRIVRAPERRIFYIDVANVPSAEVPSYVEQVKQRLRSNQVIDRNTARVDLRYNPMCLSLDTTVKLSDGCTISLKDLIAMWTSGHREIFVSSVDNDGNVIPGRVTWAGMTRTDADLVRLITDDGSQFDVTPDHRFMLSDGTYMRADSLSVGAVLMSVPDPRCVSSVVRLDTRSDTGCITVETYRNFAIIGNRDTNLQNQKTEDNVTQSCVFVHNSIDEDYWLPVRGADTGTKIDTLKGGENTAAVEDVQYIQRKLFAALRIPKAYLGFDDLLCLSGCTLVPTLDRATWGKAPSVEELASECERDETVFSGKHWIYSCDSDGKIVPSRLLRAWKTKDVDEILEVTLDDGSTVRCTCNHPFMMRDGTFTRADMLRQGDSLMPYYSRLSVSKMRGGEGLIDGYHQIRQPNTGAWVYSHRIASESKYGSLLKRNNIVHHIDFNKLNNHPDNLLRLESRADHQHLHASLNKESKVYIGAGNPRYNHEITFSTAVDVARDAASKNEILKALRCGPTAFKRLLKENGHTYRSFASTYMKEDRARYRCDGYTDITYESVIDAVKGGCSTREAVSQKFGVSTQVIESRLSEKGYSSFTEFRRIVIRDLTPESVLKSLSLWKNSRLSYENDFSGVCSWSLYSSFIRQTFGGVKSAFAKLGLQPTVGYMKRNNHKVSSVRVVKLDSPIPVYDLEVEGNHNFAIITDPDCSGVGAGVFVHNSSKSTLSQEDVRFSRTVNVVQRTAIAELNKVATIHLYVHGYRDDDLVDFVLTLPNPSTVAQQQKLELIRAKFDIAGSVPENMVDRRYVQSEVLGLTEKQIEDVDEGLFEDARFKSELEAAGAEPGEGGGGGGGGGGSLFGGGEPGGGGEDMGDLGDLGGGGGGEEPEPEPGGGEGGEIAAGRGEEGEELLLSVDDRSTSAPIKPSDRIERERYNRSRRDTRRRDDVLGPDIARSFDRERDADDPNDTHHMRAFARMNAESYGNTSRKRSFVAPDVLSSLGRLTKRMNLPTGGSRAIMTETVDVQDAIDGMHHDERIIDLTVDEEDDK